MQPPELPSELKEIDCGSEENKVWNLNKAIYGLKQAARMWNKELEGQLMNMGFYKSNCEKCICISLWQVAALQNCCHYMMRSHPNYTTPLNHCNSLKLIWCDTDATERVLLI